MGHHPQPVGPGSHAGRLIRWQRGGRGRRPGAREHGQRRRRIHAHPGWLLGAGRLEAEPRSHPPPRSVRLADRGVRPAHHHRGRQRPSPRHHRRAPRRRSSLPPGVGPPLRRADRVAAGGGSAGPVVGRPRLRGAHRRGCGPGRRGRRLGPGLGGGASARRRRRGAHRSRPHLAEQRSDGPVARPRGGDVAVGGRRSHALLARHPRADQGLPGVDLRRGRPAARAAHPRCGAPVPRSRCAAHTYHRRARLCR